jgi:hypothetical protein
MTQFTFKPQAKHHAKRFLIKTHKLESLWESYLTQHEGQWGCWLDADGNPVPSAAVTAAQQPAPEDDASHPKWEGAGTLVDDEPAAIEVPAEEATQVSPTGRLVDLQPVFQELPSADAPPFVPMLTGDFSGIETRVQEATGVTASGVYGEEGAASDPVGVATSLALSSTPADLAAIFANFAAQQKTAIAAERSFRAAVVIDAHREVRNGVQKQSAGTIGDTLWHIFDAIGPTCTLSQARIAAAAAAVNRTTANIHYYRWRQFYGHTSPTN